MTSNVNNFNATVTQAETILATIEQSGLYAKDIQDLRGKIEAIKKEIYDIQTLALDEKKSLFDFDPNTHHPIGVFEHDKKVTLIAKEGVISDYALGDTSFKMQSYPSGETAKDFTVLEDGSFYILTDSNRIL
jgi:hypothetical protein